MTLPRSTLAFLGQANRVAAFATQASQAVRVAQDAAASVETLTRTATPAAAATKPLRDVSWAATAFLSAQQAQLSRLTATHRRAREALAALNALRGPAEEAPPITKIANNGALVVTGSTELTDDDLDAFYRLADAALAYVDPGPPLTARPVNVVAATRTRAPPHRLTVPAGAR